MNVIIELTGPKPLENNKKNTINNSNNTRINDKNVNNYSRNAPNKKSKKTIDFIKKFIVYGVLPSLLGAAIWSYFDKHHFPEEKKVHALIEEYRNITNSSNYPEAEKLYAPYVIRYYNHYNIEKDSVIKLIRNYNRALGVRGKISEIQWKTLEIKELDNKRAGVSFYEYYQLERDDKTKDSLFHLKKNFIINGDYKIESEYEERK